MDYPTLPIGFLDGHPFDGPGSHQGCLYMYIYKPPELRGAEKTGVCGLTRQNGCPNCLEEWMGIMQKSRSRSYKDGRRKHILILSFLQGTHEVRRIQDTSSSTLTETRLLGLVYMPTLTPFQPPPNVGKYARYSSLPNAMNIFNSANPK